MRHAAYLCTSRHGIFYFRLPLPPRLHPRRKRTDLKVSLRTRSPARAKAISRLMIVSGQSELARTSNAGMRYEEIRDHVRQHFSEMLERFQNGIADNGPLDGINLSSLTGSQSLAEAGAEDWADHAHPEGATGLLKAFVAGRGISEDLGEREKHLLLSELHKGYRAYISKALEHNQSFDRLGLEDASVEPETDKIADEPNEPVVAFEDAVSQYFNEIRRAGSLAAKTETEKRDALALLGQITDSTAPAHLIKSHARAVKDVLLKLPKNRNKSPSTRDLNLTEMLALENVERITARTCNAYISHMQRFMNWAEDNGHAADNPFQGMRIALPKSKKNDGRKSYSREQIRLIYHHLTRNPDGHVRKDVHKWPTLIGMFTGMRLNEIAQLEIADIVCIDGVWCFDVTEDGGNKKRLKNAASRRRVPIYDKLLECGLLDYLEQQRATGVARLFPSLTYTVQNGYGRNVGRWFNESLLPAIGLSGQGLCFHCLRHTMVTRPGQSDVPEIKVKAIAGHRQSGVTFNTYFKGGFRPAQLREALHKFEL